MIEKFSIRECRDQARASISQRVSIEQCGRRYYFSRFSQTVMGYRWPKSFQHSYHCKVGIVSPSLNQVRFYETFDQHNVMDIKLCQFSYPELQQQVNFSSCLLQRMFLEHILWESKLSILRSPSHKRKLHESTQVNRLS